MGILMADGIPKGNIATPSLTSIMPLVDLLRSTLSNVLKLSVIPKKLSSALAVANNSSLTTPLI